MIMGALRNILLIGSVVVVILVLVWWSSDSGEYDELEEYNAADIVLNCSVSITNFSGRKYMLYKPLHVCKGVLPLTAVDENGFLKEKSRISNDANAEGQYIVYIKKVEEPPIITEFGFNYEWHVSSNLEGGCPKGCINQKKRKRDTSR